MSTNIILGQLTPVLLVIAVPCYFSNADIDIRRLFNVLVYVVYLFTVNHLLNGNWPSEPGETLFCTQTPLYILQQWLPSSFTHNEDVLSRLCILSFWAVPVLLMIENPARYGHVVFETWNTLADWFQWLKGKFKFSF